MTTLIPSRASEQLHEVHCRSCGALVGRQFATRLPAVYCLDPICPYVPPTTAYEERDALLIVLRQVHDWSNERLGALIGVGRQRVAQIFIERFGGPVPAPRAVRP